MTFWSLEIQGRCWAGRCESSGLFAGLVNCGEMSRYHFQKTKEKQIKGMWRRWRQVLYNSLAIFVTAFEDRYDKHGYDFPLRPKFSGRLVT